MLCGGEEECFQEKALLYWSLLGSAAINSRHSIVLAETIPHRAFNYPTVLCYSFDLAIVLNALL